MYGAEGKTDRMLLEGRGQWIVVCLYYVLVVVLFFNLAHLIVTQMLPSPLITHAMHERMIKI